MGRRIARTNMPPPDNTLTIIMAMGSDTRLHPLTAERTKAAVPFGGTYRVIDFALTNCLHSGLRRILVLTQYRSHSLQKHLRDGWSIFNPELGEYITTVPPQMRMDNSWYGGPADAVRQNLYLLERNPAEHVFVLSGEHVYRMDYAALLEFHAGSDADVTVACLDDGNQNGRATSCQVAVAADNRISAYARTGVPFAIDDNVITTLGSMEVYAFRKSVLIDMLSRPNFVGSAQHDLGLDLIPTILASGQRVLAYRFGGSAGRVSRDRYWRGLDSLDDYYDANMGLLHTEPDMDLYQSDWPIRTYHGQYPPARTVPGGSSDEGIFINSIVASGTIIAGGGVNHSILFPSVYVDDSATVEDSILLADVQVGRGARLHRCIVDKGVKIPPAEALGYDRTHDAMRFTVTEGGIVVIPKDYRFN